MSDLDSLDTRLNHYLKQIAPSHMLGASGLAVLSAASLLALAPAPGQALGAAVVSWVGNLGLNVLAGVLQRYHEELLSEPSADEMGPLTRLAESLSRDIRRDARLRVEIGTFLDTLDAFDIAREVLQGNLATHGWLLAQIFHETTYYRADLEHIHKKLAVIEDRLDDVRFATRRLGSAPPPPLLFIGRNDAMDDLKERLGVSKSVQELATVQVLMAIRGWPGVGKTTLAAALAHDEDIAETFPDGVLWASLGPTPNLLSNLATWGRALAADDLLLPRTVEEASARLAALLRDKRILLIVDDVWKTEHAIPFKVGGRGCAMLITTRLNGVAQALAPTPNDIYRLAVLDEEKAFELLQTLAPSVVAQHPVPSLELVRDLEGLPLALQVAGHLLNVEASYGFSATDLLAELRKGAKLLEAKAPADRVDLANEVTPTVAVLLQKSTQRLDDQTRDCFAILGAFAPKPATFDLEAMKAVWQVQTPGPTAHTLVDRGLLEFIPELGRYQMHALLVMHAKSLLTE